MSQDRSWMYRHIGEKRRITDEYRIGVEEFLNFAYDHPECVDDGKIRCPCKRCRCLKYQERDEVHHCLLRFGFESNYTTWTRHGEVEEAERNDYLHEENVQWARDMVIEAAGSSLEQSTDTNEKPNDEASNFYKLLEDGDEPLWEGCKEYTKLSAVTRLLYLKSEYGLSNKGFEEHLKVIKGMLPGGEKLPESYYRVNAMMKKLGLSYEIIHACKNDCVLFWRENAKLNICPTCKESRYKTNGKGNTKNKPIPWKVLRYFPITPRLQRLYMSSKTAAHMRWHSEKRKDINGEMRHPADCEAWKDFDRQYPEFAEEVRNVRLGLASDGFNPFGHSSISHSTWPVFVVPYNLPPWMCMKQSYIFMSLIISGPKSPGRDIDVYLRPLIEELKVLWTDGVLTYDASLKKNFRMKAAILWTISDFPAYGMLSGGSTHGKLSCPYCMDNEVAFQLTNGRKPCYFGCHRRWLKRNHKWRKEKEKFNNQVEMRMAPPQRSGDYVLNVVSGFEQIKFGKWNGSDGEKFPGFGVWHNWTKKSIFFDLPYWSKLLIRHNLDVMHIEKNVFDNVFNTVINVKGRSKDHKNARKDLCALGIRHELHVVELSAEKYSLPKSTYTLSNEQIKQVYEWLKMLKVPDGYASNISRCVNLAENKINGLKTHDCHVLMERFLPLAFRDFLPKSVWEPLTSLSYFFRDICSKVYKEDDLEKLEKSIIDTLCQLEMIFPPSFFDSMEHLPIHLAYEAQVGGPVQYRWMYPFERYMCNLKKKVRNRAYPEGSIAEAYRIEELVTFCSRYFDLKVDTKLTRPGRNDDKGEPDNNGNISIFCLPGRAIGRGDHRFLTDEEYKSAALYVLTSYDENGNFMSKHKAELRRNYPDVSIEELEELHDLYFFEWFKTYAIENNEVDSHAIQNLANGPSRCAKCYDGYIVNGFRFHTVNIEDRRTTQNSGVLVRGSCYGENERDYYGKLVEVVELDYVGIGNKVVLFKCEWFDVDRGVQVDKKYGIVDVNTKSKLKSNDPFVLAKQATQVFYASSMSKKRKGWASVIIAKARNTYDIPVDVNDDDDDDDDDDVAETYQEDEVPCANRFNVDYEVYNPILHDKGQMGEEVRVEGHEDVEEDNNNYNSDGNGEDDGVEDDFDLDLDIVDADADIDD